MNGNVIYSMVCHAEGRNLQRNGAIMCRVGQLSYGEILGNF